MAPINWDAVEKATIALAAAGSMAAVILTPFGDKLYMWMFKRSRNELVACLNHWYKQEHQEHDTVVSDLASLRLRFEDHVKRQAERDSDLLIQFKNMIAQQNTVMAQQTETLKAIQEEASSTSRSVAHIYGILEKEPWDGQTERRQGDRRG